MGNILQDYGEIESLVPCQYKSKGVKVDAYHYDDEFKDFTLIVSHFLDEDDPSKARVSNDEVNSLFRSATNFLTRSLKNLQNKIDISNEAHELASLITKCKGDIRTAKIVLITDGITQKRPADIDAIDGIEIIRTIWDIERSCHYCRTGEREKITIEFTEFCGGPLPCVVRKSETNIYSTYLGFIPGIALANMYARWGIKMLDMNVRVFLSARGNVNKGIRETILKEPDMFCAYNNGITIFARSVEITATEAGLGLVCAEDFQIVNGGQTTASLYHTQKKDRAALNNIFVQMKLTVIHNPEDVPRLVPKMSEYSNTQNKVQMADLAANLSPHQEIQTISNNILSPDPTGGSQQTYWFYERARGSYEECRNLAAKTPAQKRQFDALRPKHQKFDKIKLGKVWNTCLRLPHVVSLGGQKNFGWFNEWLREQKEEDWKAFFRKTVALIVLWNSTEKIVRRQGFQGYHHNIVAYTLAWLFHLTGSRIDLERIWQKQAVGEPILDVLESMSGIVNEHIRNTQQNVTEYCKREECWDKLKVRDFVLPGSIRDEYISEISCGKYDPTILNENKVVEFCKNKGSKG
ncbi:MAG: AIPR family protein [Planctomycetes bacterium]|nr:AIPR family protein [Planctomycetota bacterium]